MQVGIEFEDLYDKLSVYPNPTTGKINIEYENTNNKIKVSLFNSYGQKLFETYENQIDISAHPSGIYLLLIETDNNRSIKKVIKN